MYDFPNLLGSSLRFTMNDQYRFQPPLGLAIAKKDPWRLKKKMWNFRTN